MPIIASAIIPHSPILLPSIGTHVADKLTCTLQSMRDIGRILTDLSIETIVLLTNPDMRQNSDTLQINTCETYVASFEEFGDFATRSEIKCDTVLGLHIKKGFEEQGIPATFASQEKLDYSASIPLSLLELQNIKLIVIQPPDHSMKALMRYGTALHHRVQQSDKRIAVLASGDLSHSLTESAPLGLKLEGTVLDQDIIALFRSRRLPIRKIQSFSKEAAIRTGICGLNAFAMLAGILHHMNFKMRFHSYEGPLGVGYFVISYTF